MDMLEGAKIIPYWENESWQANEGTAPLKPSYFRRSLTYILNEKKVDNVERVFARCVSIYSDPITFEKIAIRRTMSI